jgi:FkbM family methyltransferase
MRVRGRDAGTSCGDAQKGSTSGTIRGEAVLIPVYTPKYLDLIYDVGLHKGEDAEFYLRKGFRVVAFEADPDLIAYCRERLKEFLDNGRLTIIEGAIMDPDLTRAGHTTVPFYKNKDTSVWGTVRADWAERNARLGTSSSVIELDAIDFADAIREHGVPYFMKIDVEGCDTVCVGALIEFEERPSYISIESDKTSFNNVEREIDLFIKLGYTSFQAVEQSRIPRTQSPPYPPTEGKYVSHHFEEGCSGLFGSELKGKWKSRGVILRQFRLIRLGYLLVGDDGILRTGGFGGTDLLRRLTKRVLGLLTHTAVPGWYDTHARHSSADAANAILPRRDG